MSEYSLFTSESVSEGHPDKIAYQISDAVLDAIIAEDKYARVACETLVKTGVAIIAGEVTTSAWVDLEDIAPVLVQPASSGYFGEAEELARTKGFPLLRRLALRKTPRAPSTKRHLRTVPAPRPGQVTPFRTDPGIGF